MGLGRFRDVRLGLVSGIGLSQPEHILSEKSANERLKNWEAGHCRHEYHERQDYARSI